MILILKVDLGAMRVYVVLKPMEPSPTMKSQIRAHISFLASEVFLKGSILRDKEVSILSFLSFVFFLCL